jgi:outer membrane immunogenic protein
MRKWLLGTTTLAALLLAGAAQAADLPRKAPGPVPYAPPPFFSWTGFYIGAHVGAGWGTKEYSDFADTGVLIFSGPLGSYTVNGFLGGGQIGYNWQSGRLVLGIEADASWADIKGSGFIFPVSPISTKIESLGTITGRIGGTIDHALIYLKGGGAWVHEKHSIDGFTTSSKSRWGWTVGAGVEYGLTPNWSAKIEYNYLDFGRKTHTFAEIEDPGDSISWDVRQTIHTFKFGVNYRFGAPLVARY